jgi:hypothetical protein
VPTSTSTIQRCPQSKNSSDAQADTATAAAAVPQALSSLSLMPAFTHAQAAAAAVFR